MDMEQIMTFAQKAQTQFVIPLMGEIVDEKRIAESITWWKHQNQLL